MKDFEGVAAVNKCAHCGEPITKGDLCRIYVEPNPAAQTNDIKMMVHERCWPLFVGPSGHVQ